MSQLNPSYSDLGAVSSTERSSSQDGTAKCIRNSQQWRAHSWRCVPSLTILSIAAAVLGGIAAFIVLVLAHDKPVDTWPISPTVYLSIIATLSNTCIRFIFQSGFEVFWWTRLVSERGITLGELHQIWELSQSAFTLLQQAPQSFKLARTATLLVVLLAVNGPMLQRAITVELATQTSSRFDVLDVRVQPVWNLTVVSNNADFGHAWSTGPYQPEFAQVFSEWTDKQPALLPGTPCRDNATCTATVTVAGFARECVEKEVSIYNLTTLQPAQYVVRISPQESPSPNLDNGFVCFKTTFDYMEDLNGTWTSAECALLETHYQLGLLLDGGESPTINYTSYIRKDGHSNMISMTNCNFTTAFIPLTIEISNRNEVSISKASPSPPDVTSIERIPGASFVQVVRDSFEGYVFFDWNEGGNMISGAGPRKFLNSSSISKRTNDTLPAFRAIGYTQDILDPLENFTSTLNELSLHYAMARIPNDDADRVAANDAYLRQWGDVRSTSLPQIQRPLSNTQNVTVSESRVVAVYKANYVYTGVVMGVILLSTFTFSTLLRGCTGLGRDFSMSPLEVAKAFDAPILRGVGSNMTAGQIEKSAGSVKVRYGEVVSGKQSCDRDAAHRGEEREEVPEVMGMLEPDGKVVRSERGARLMIRRYGEVEMPRNGEVYL